MSVGLSVISNDAEAVKNLITQYGEYFDAYFVTVADKNKDAYYELQKLKDDKLKLSYFKWCDHFGKARQYNFEQIDTDYFLWLDSDDVLVNPENIEECAAIMEAKGLDALYMRYDYAQNELGEAIGDHWRERLVRTKSPLRWSDSRVHETLIAKAAMTDRTDAMYVLHNKTSNDEQKSMERNIKLLELDFKETQDPRTAMYLGDNLVAMKQYDEAIPYLVFLLQNGGWDEDKYRTWLKMAEIHYIKQDFASALDCCYAAEELQPDWPDAFFMKASVYAEMKKPKNVYENIKVGVLKGRPQTASVINPTLYEYRALFLGAIAAAELGKVDEAFKLLQTVLAKSPDYAPAKDLLPIIEEAYYDGQAIDKVRWLLYYLKDNGGIPVELFKALPQRVLADPRLNADRAKLMPSETWPKGSIAYFCGRTGEVWGADTLEKGMGGSEEAVVYLSRELSKLGHKVVVFNEREDSYFDGDIEYRPWQLLNPNDTFDTFIGWRIPESVQGVNARNVFVDLHDTVEAERVYDTLERNPDVKFFVKSAWHRKLYPDAPDDAFVIVGNGIVKEQFDEA